MSQQNILVRGYDADGKRAEKRVPYEPYLFIKANEETGITALDGTNLKKVEFSGIYQARDFIKKYQNVMPIYGMTTFVYPYINDTFPGQLDFKFDQINVGILDIEVGSKEGFPEPKYAEQEVTAICVYAKGLYHTFGCGDYTPHHDKVRYYKCRSEKDLLRKFVLAWQAWDFDIVTGWNSDFFDIPYLINRITKVLGPQHVKKLSPWGQIRSRETRNEFGGEETLYTILGLACIDYMELYKKHAYIPQEKYNLDTVAFNDLGVAKIDYSEYRSLHSLYEENFQKFVEYNIRDCELIKGLDDKHGLMNVVILLALDSKTTFVDAFGSVRLWDVIIHNDLAEKHIAVNPPSGEFKTEKFAGAFVKPPICEMHHSVVSFDFEALYPRLIWEYNISPETYRGRLPIASINVEACLRGVPLEDAIQEYLKEHNYSLTANGYVWDKSVEGVLPRLVKKSLADRKLYKEKMLAAQAKYEETQDEKYKAEAQRWKVLQHVRKIQINSLYGCLGSEFFRWFRIAAAEGITMTGQFMIQWAQKRINEELAKMANVQGYDFIIAMDTDSAYLRLDKLLPIDIVGEQDRVAYLLKWCDEVMEPLLVKIFTEAFEMLNGKERVLRMKRESVANKGFWTAKKRYALNVYNQEGVAYKEPKVKVTGLESIKSSTPTIMRKWIDESIKILLQGTEEELQKYCAQRKTDYKQLSFDQIAFPKGVNGIAKYSDPNTIFGWKTPIHTKGAILFNHIVKERGLDNVYQPIKDGEKIKWLYLELPNPTNTEVLSCPNDLPEEFNLKPYIDYVKMFDKSYIEPVGKMARACGWRLQAGGTLEDAFNAPI